MAKILSKFGEQQLVMVNYACGFHQSETGKYFEWVTISNIWSIPRIGEFGRSVIWSFTDQLGVRCGGQLKAPVEGQKSFEMERIFPNLWVTRARGEKRSSGSGAYSCPTELISSYLDKIMAPTVRSLPSYVKDDALQIFRDFNCLGADKLIFTISPVPQPMSSTA